MEKQKVLFICVHNSARSQMAEALLNNIAGDKFQAESAGFEAGTLNPVAVETMRRMNIDISGKKTREVFEIYKTGRIFNYVITVCDEANAERCPIFPGIAKRLNWSFQDPSAFQGTFEERVEQTIKVRDEIKLKILDFIKLYN
ncbi:MAG: arsenate reductase ArsC [Bacteroidota bacterium]